MGQCEGQDYQTLTMKYSLLIRKEAEADIAEAHQFYESCRENLGSDFLLCLETTFARITKNPSQFQPVYKHIYRALPKRFPYGVYYIVLESTILVVGVIHVRRSPAHLHARV